MHNLLSPSALVVATLFLSTVGWHSATGNQPMQARTCDSPQVTAITDKDATGPIYVACSIRFPNKTKIQRTIIFEGANASGATLDCNGGAIDTSAGKKTSEKIAIIVRSKRTSEDRWEAPRYVTVKNCEIRGLMRVYGLDENANGPNMRASSINANHTAFAQKSAPSHISFLNLSIEAIGGAALYIGPGATWTTIADSDLRGYVGGTAIYMDAESSDNSITNNTFSVRTKSRELIAIDGSAHNRITSNTFNDPLNGGIFLYRNCGEGGVIRHQRPQLNLIARNTFTYTREVHRAKPAVWLGSRQGNRKHCFSDPRHSFGSSLSPLDFARKNEVKDNSIFGGFPQLIRNSDTGNVVHNNNVYPNLRSMLAK
ncbi:right-handed parallel beta-helix repeat-containing protein [Sinorhizobium meliloti]|nr:right-handed parallel beta-helix repeat-containing protein [Sinorhizobium meliloti]